MPVPKTRFPTTPHLHLVVPCASPSLCWILSCAGSTKILFTVPLMYMILIAYAVAVAITFISREDYTCIAWDSAGGSRPSQTGPVASHLTSHALCPSGPCPGPLAGRMPHATPADACAERV